MTVTNMGWRDSLSCIRGVRNGANPNFGFQKQLQDYEHEGLQEVLFKICYFTIIFYCISKLACCVLRHIFLMSKHIYHVHFVYKDWIWESVIKFMMLFIEFSFWTLHTIIYFCPHRLSHHRLYIWCNIAMRNPFSKPTNDGIYIYYTVYLLYLGKIY